MQSEPLLIESEETQPAMSPQDYISILRRRRSTIITTWLVISAFGILVTLATRSVYQATAKLLVDGPTLTTQTDDSNIANYFNIGSDQTVDTKVEELQANPLMSQVGQHTHNAKVTVASVKGTNVIGITGESTDKKDAARAPNLLIQLYLANKAKTDLQEIHKAQAFAQKQIASAQARLNSANTRNRELKRKGGFVDIKSSRDDASARVATLTQQYQSAQASLAGARALVSGLRTLVAAEPATLDVQIRQTNAEIATLKSRITQLELQRSQMMLPGGYTAKAPQVKAIDAEISTLQTRLAGLPAVSTTMTSNPNTVRESLRTKLASSEGDVANLEASVLESKSLLTQAKNELATFPTYEAPAEQIQNEHDAALSAYQMYSTTLQNLNLREQARHVSAHVIEPAVIPSQPVRPKKALNFLFAIIMGGVIGILMALLQEYLDDRLNSTEDAERLLGLPSLGRVPQLSRDDALLLSNMGGPHPELEAYKTLRTNIHFAAIDTPFRSLQVTSSSPGEGKTTTATNLAYAMAADGKRVVLIDTDLRRPSVHKHLDLSQTPGVTEILVGDATLQEALQVSPNFPNLSVLAAGTIPPNPSELLNSQKFRSMVEQLSSRCDIIIFDSAPVLAVADAQIVASQADGVVLVVANGETRKTAAKQAQTLLRRARANVIGVAFNKMNVKDTPAYYQYTAATSTEALPGRNGHSTRQIETEGTKK
jgi:succinoglycan biosynthesis transport protein ExoP